MLCFSVCRNGKLLLKFSIQQDNDQVVSCIIEIWCKSRGKIFTSKGIMEIRFCVFFNWLLSLSHQQSISLLALRVHRMQPEKLLYRDSLLDNWTNYLHKILTHFIPSKIFPWQEVISFGFFMRRTSRGVVSGAQNLY